VYDYSVKGQREKKKAEKKEKERKGAMGLHYSLSLVCRFL